MRNYFIKFDPKAQINYLYLFQLYGIAEHSIYTKSYDIIPYRTIKELAERLKAAYGKYAMSYSTLRRILYSIEYTNYFRDNGLGYIKLNNEFSNRVNTEKEPFIIITDKEANFLISQKKKELASYFCYIKYYCGFSAKAGKKQDFTIKQYLQTIGKSVDNHNNISTISGYNTLLSREGYIKIEKYRDDLGNERNIYTVPLQSDHFDRAS